MPLENQAPNIEDFNRPSDLELKTQFIRELKDGIAGFYQRTKNDHLNIFDIIVGNGRYTVPEIVQELGPVYVQWLLEISGILNVALKKVDPNYVEPNLGIEIQELLQSLNKQ